ncbi:hypothetical protein A2U01_0079303, partial [Trifolium medium]|nr:hypothetical protein [Trifolium medium]
LLISFWLPLSASVSTDVVRDVLNICPGTSVHPP